MGKSLTTKILESHLLSGQLIAGQEVKLKVNQTLTQDTTGTMAYLQFLAMDVDKVHTDLSVAYVDHNLLQASFENADDHAFIASVASKYGIVYSKPGSGICHQVHLEQYAKPGTILVGSDSHTPNAGGIGALAIGMGGLDIAIAMATGQVSLTVPKVFNVNLIGKPQAFINGKDIILKVLKELSVTGGVGYVMEYTGEALKYLSVTDRATVTNMGAELGATSSIFQSDTITLHYLTQQGRPQDYVEIGPDQDAVYDNQITIDLSVLKPMIAQPHMPDNVTDVASVKGLKVDQVAIGSCTNSSYADLMKVAKILKGKTIHPDVSFVVSPGSANILKLISDNGALGDIISAGARILESGCGPCIGMGQAPKTGAVSLRSFNRNFKGRSGTANAQVYLVSPETAAYSAIHGVISDVTQCGIDLSIEDIDSFGKVDGFIVMPSKNPDSVKIETGPNIQPFPKSSPILDAFKQKVILKVGDNVTTDDIVPSYAKLLPFRSNIPELAKYCFHGTDPEFYNRALENEGGIIFGQENYGQGSSREHAALIPLYLGVKAVIAKSFARIHRTNLINAAILPLIHVSGDMAEGDVLSFTQIHTHIKSSEPFEVLNETQNTKVLVSIDLTPRQVDVLLKGGYLNYIKHEAFGA